MPLESPAAVARYERLFAELVADGVLEGWAEDELRAARRDLGIAEATHESIAGRYSLRREVTPIGLEVDAGALAALIAQAPGAVCVRVTNNGSRALRNVVLREVIVGNEGILQHAARLLPPGRDEIFATHLAGLPVGQFVLQVVVQTEAVSGNLMHFRGEPFPFTVAERGAAGPQTVVAHIDASAMRVGDFSGLQIGAMQRAAGGAVEARWARLALRTMSDADWLAWEDAHDGGKRRSAVHASAVEAHQQAQERARAAALEAAERQRVLEAAEAQRQAVQAAAIRERAEVEQRARAAEAEQRAAAEEAASAARRRGEAEVRAEQARLAAAWQAEDRQAQERATAAALAEAERQRVLGAAADERQAVQAGAIRERAESEQRARAAEEAKRTAAEEAAAGARWQADAAVRAEQARLAAAWQAEEERNWRQTEALQRAAAYELERSGEKERGALLRVAADGSGDARRISEALERIAEDGTIEVAAGRYDDSFVVAKRVTIRAVAGARVVLVPPDQGHPLLLQAEALRLELEARGAELSASVALAEKALAEATTRKFGSGEAHWPLAVFVSVACSLGGFSIRIFTSVPFMNALVGTVVSTSGYAIALFIAVQLVSKFEDTRVSRRAMYLILGTAVVASFGSGFLNLVVWHAEDALGPEVLACLAGPLVLPVSLALLLLVSRVVYGAIWDGWDERARRLQTEVSDARARLEAEDGDRGRRKYWRYSVGGQLVTLNAECTIEGLEIELGDDPLPRAIRVSHRAAGFVTLARVAISASGAEHALIWVDGEQLQVALNDVRLTGGRDGIVIAAGRLGGHRLVVDGATRFGIWSGGARVDLEDTNIERCGVGMKITKGVASASNTTISDCVGYGIWWTSSDKGGKFTIKTRRNGAFAVVGTDSTNDNYTVSYDDDGSVRGPMRSLLEDPITNGRQG